MGSVSTPDNLRHVRPQHNTTNLPIRRYNQRHVWGLSTRRITYATRDLNIISHNSPYAGTANATNGGRRREIGAGEVSGENRHFPAAGAAADLGGGLGRDAEAEPVLLAPVPTAAAAGGPR
ncbi:hypothetical protein L3X38_042447 [Prunus dulcis]|uniref:Uncharacterized protein n=1 Tax=Prunus dulcis TaxID=3755 RepID=A0AAD4UVY8_PRUDU|nr:hypothetical protein L3X38_042447 [Prunus dulcis]